MKSYLTGTFPDFQNLYSRSCVLTSLRLLHSRPHTYRAQRWQSSRSVLHATAAKPLDAGEIHLQLQKDMEGALVSGVPVDSFVAAVYGLKFEELRLAEWSFSLSPDLLDEYRRCTIETGHYRPFMNMMMQLLLDYVQIMKELDPASDITFPCGFYFDATNGEEKIYGSDGTHERKLDGSLTADAGHMGYQRLREKYANVNPDDPDFKLFWDYIMAWFEFKFSNTYKTKNAIVTPAREAGGYAISSPAAQVAPEPEDIKKGRKRSKASKRSASSDPDAPGAKRFKSGLVGISEESPALLSEPLGHAGRSLGYSRGKPGGINLLEAPGADYAAESLRTGRRRYSTGVFIHDGNISLWYYGRMGPICSRQFNPQDDPQLLLLVTVALARADLHHLGFEPMLVAGTNTLPLPMRDCVELRKQLNPLGEQTRFADLRELYGSPSACEAPFLEWAENVLRLTCELDIPDSPPSSTTDSSAPSDEQLPPSAQPLQSTTIDFPITAPPLYVQPGAIGRGTVVLPLACPAGIDTFQAKDGLVAKMSWQPLTRMAEDETLRIIRRTIPKPWTMHVTDLKCATTLDSDALKLPRKELMAIIEMRVDAVAALRKPDRVKHADKDVEFLEMADAFIGNDYEERVLRVLVTPRYLPLKDVMNVKEFKTVFKDVVKGKSPVCTHRLVHLTRSPFI